MHQAWCLYRHHEPTWGIQNIVSEQFNSTEVECVCIYSFLQLRASKSISSTHMCIYLLNYQGWCLYTGNTNPHGACWTLYPSNSCIPQKWEWIAQTPTFSNADANTKYCKCTIIYSTFGNFCLLVVRNVILFIIMFCKSRFIDESQS